MIATAHKTPLQARKLDLGSLVTALSESQDKTTILARLTGWLANQTNHVSLVAQLTTDGDFEIWQAAPSSPVTRERWDRYEAGLDALLTLTEPALFDKLDQSAADLLRHRVWLLPHHTMMATSLPAGPALSTAIAPGCILVFDAVGARGMSAQDLSEIARLTTLFLDRVSLKQRVARLDVEFTAVSGISRALAGSLDLTTIFNQLNGPIRQTLDVETLSVGMLEPATGDIVFVNELMGPEFAQLPTIRVKKGQGIAGWVAENREPVIINDTYADKRFYSGVDSKSGFRTRSMICIPLQVEEQTVGVLQAINRQSGQFTESDLAVLQAVGGPLAAAIVNANLNRDKVVEQKRLDTILSQFAPGVAIVNEEQILLRTNEAFAQLIGKNEAQLTGIPISDIVKLKTADLAHLISRAVASPDGRAERMDALLRANGKTLPVLIETAVVDADYFASQGKEIAIVFTDLSMAQELERMREDLFQGIVNELRTPLATILLYARLLRNGRATTEEKEARFLGVIERESDRLQLLVRQMLDLSRLEAQEFRRSAYATRLNPILEELALSVSDRAQAKGLLFRSDIAEDLPPVLGTPELFELIFGSLLDNAIKYTPTGAVELSAQREQDSLVIRVMDDGIGIPPQALPHLFKRFYRTNLAVERGVAGTGLGLYLVRQSLQAIEGKIEISSKQGQGTTFTVRLPISEDIV